ncbi:GIN domain-containing protein [Robertkochia sediminum]|uniref:GIN domain-containing protein n=1 Tax=Robertkochia sediminum TaxID=2785326 RepID=UPI00193282DF|nr:DUF2807 domain-containing protein [Robertkochia sediminum]MBL7472441.1 DUF2807 domain-containing protein [Robertkochia sediminum]
MFKILCNTILLFLLMAGAQGCDVSTDCLGSAGESVRREITLSSFDGIVVYEDIELIVAKGEAQKVEVIAGKNLIDDVALEVAEGKLIVSTKRPCAFTSGNKVVQLVVTTPELSEIRSYTQYAVRSEGVLDFDRLRLISVVLSETTGVAIGEFFLNVDVNTLEIEANVLANFEISGKADHLRLRMVDNSVRGYMPDLEVMTADIYHRSAHDITIRPTVSVTGSLWGTGDLILLNTPPVVEVEENYTGKVIYD